MTNESHAERFHLEDHDVLRCGFQSALLQELSYLLVLHPQPLGKHWAVSCCVASGTIHILMQSLLQASSVYVFLQRLAFAGTGMTMI